MSERTWVPLNARERRIVGVLIEKQKTTPEYYPMSVSALVSGCNQKSNRDPVTNYDADDVEETLHELRRKGVVMQVEGSGRVTRWRHNMYEWLDLKNRPVDMAILAELLLRGPQTEGELRSRASRMEAIADLPTLQTHLDFLTERALIAHLSPPGQRRGVILTHGLYPPDEFERLRDQHGQGAVPEAREGAVRRAPDDTPTVATGELAALRDEVDRLAQQLQDLRAEVQRLKEALGA